MRKSLSEQSVSKQLFTLTIAWLCLSLLDVVANKLWHLNPNWSWKTSLGAGVIYGILILAVQSFFKDLFKSNNKLRYLLGFILYVIFWFLINWHRLH